MMNVLHPANIRGSHPPGVEILSDSGRRKDHLHHHHASPLVAVSDASNSANTASSMCTPTGTIPRANKRQLEISESSDDAACPKGTISTAGEGLLKRLKLAYTEYKNEHHQHDQPHRPLPVTSKLPPTRSPALAPSSSLAAAVVAASSASALSDYEDIVSSALQEISRDHEEDNRWVDQLSHLGDVDHSTVVERQQGASTAARTAQSHHHATATAATGTMPIALGSDDPILLSCTPLKLFASILHKNDGMDDTPQQEQAKKPFESLGSPPAGRATTATMIAPAPRNPLDCQHLQHPEYEQPMLGRVLPPRAPPPPLPLIAMRPRMGLLRQQQQYLRPKPHFVPDGSLSQHERSLCHPLASNHHLSATTASVAATSGAEAATAATTTRTSLPQTDNNNTAPQIMPMNDMASVMSSPEPTVLTLTSFPFRVICANPAFFQLTGDVGREVIGSSVYNIIASGGSGGDGGVKDNKKNHLKKKGHNDDLASSSSSSSPSMATRTPMETFLHSDIVKVVVQLQQQQQQPQENFSAVNNEDDEGEPLWNHQAEQPPPVMMMVEGAVGGWNDDADMVPPDYDDDDCSSISSTNSLVVASTTTTTTTTTTSCRIQVQNVMDQKGQDLLYFSIQLSPVHLPSK